jgi:DNA-binding NarL/FixJ family response regulator
LCFTREPSISNHRNPATMQLIIVDDHKIIRDGLLVLLERDPDLRVIGEAADGRAGVDLALTLRPDVVIMDMAMPELNGIEATRQLRAAGFVGGIAMLSSHNERRFVIQARAAGVDAYVHKEFAFEQVRIAIAAAARREPYLSPDLAAQETDGRLPGVAELLTPREREVLQMLAEGHSVKDIAFSFELSPKTIESHRMNLMAKLQVDNLADLTRLAVREGLAKM